MKLAEFIAKRRFTWVVMPSKVRRLRPMYPDRGCNANEHVAVAELEIEGTRQMIVLVD